MRNTTKFSLIPDYGDPEKEPGIRAKYGYFEGIVSIIGNTILFVLKLFLGLFINSIALIADAFHTVSDSGTSAVVILGFKMADKPPDKEHPFGHGRIEYIATLIIAILLFMVGISFIEQSIGLGKPTLEKQPASLQHRHVAVVPRVLCRSIMGIGIQRGRAIGVCAANAV